MNSIVAEAMRSLAKKYDQQVKLNDMANMTRYGGKFTAAGLEQADKDAELNAMDRIRGKQMIGLGGSMME